MRGANAVAVLAALWLVGACFAGEGALKTKSEPFGKTPDGKDVTLYTLENKNGVKARIMNYGATLVSLETPDKNGKLGDVTLGFDTVTDYITKVNPFFGATAGRYANRIAKAQFTLDGKTYTLAKNNGENTLHGGKKGFDKYVWDSAPANEIADANKCGVHFYLTSPDGDEGYPGQLKVTVTYTLNNDNELAISYSAETDKTTVLNLTNHTYWNLAGAAAGTILDHEMTIYADKYVPVDAGGIPNAGLKDVKGTVMDFTTPHLIGERINQVGNEPVGYDHTWVLNGEAGKLKKCATVYDNKSGRVMEVSTTEPGVQFYTGNFMDGKTTARGNVVCNKHQGFCLEAQHFPDSPNQPAFPTTVLKPGERYTQLTVHKFGVK